MNWRKEAADKLKDYQARKKAVDNILEEISRLKAESTRIRSAVTDSTPIHGGGGSTREDALLSNIVLRDELKGRLQDTRRWLATVDKALAELTDEERLLLDRFYIHRARGNVERLCEELSMEQATVYRHRDAALRHFTMLLYGCMESL